MALLGVPSLTVIMTFAMLQSEDEWNRRFIAVGWTVATAHAVGLTGVLL